MPFLRFIDVDLDFPFLSALKSAPVIFPLGAAAPAIFFCLGERLSAIYFLAPLQVEQEHLQPLTGFALVHLQPHLLHIISYLSERV